MKGPRTPGNDPGMEDKKPAPLKPGDKVWVLATVTLCGEGYFRAHAGVDVVSRDLHTEGRTWRRDPLPDAAPSVADVVRDDLRADEEANALVARGAAIERADIVRDLRAWCQSMPSGERQWGILAAADRIEHVVGRVRGGGR